MKARQLRKVKYELLHQSEKDPSLTVLLHSHDHSQDGNKETLPAAGRSHHEGRSSGGQHVKDKTMDVMKADMVKVGYVDDVLEMLEERSRSDFGNGGLGYRSCTSISRNNILMTDLRL